MIRIKPSLFSIRKLIQKLDKITKDFSKTFKESILKNFHTIHFSIKICS